MNETACTKHPHELRQLVRTDTGMLANVLTQWKSSDGPVASVRIWHKNSYQFWLLACVGISAIAGWLMAYQNLLD